MKPYALGIVGAGAIGSVHVECTASLAQARLAAICDPREELAAAVAAKTGARPYASYEDLAYEERLDGIILCTPPVTHPSIATFFLERGVDVLCEKPLAVSGAQARDMYACARRNGRLLQLASKFRYVGDVATARELVRDGTLGAIRHAEIAFISSVDMRDRWNADPSISGGGVVIDNGSHAADLCRYLFGPVTHVAAVGYSRTEGMTVEDSAYLYLGVGHGPGVTVDLSWSLDRKLPFYVRIFGEYGRLCIGWRETTLTRAPGGTTAVGSGYSKADAFTAVQRDFVEASIGRARARIDANDALASVDVVDAAYASMRDGGRAPVEAERSVAV